MGNGQRKAQSKKKIKIISAISVTGGTVTQQVLSHLIRTEGLYLSHESFHRSVHSFIN